MEDIIKWWILVIEYFNILRIYYPLTKENSKLIKIHNEYEIGVVILINSCPYTSVITLT